MIQMIHRRELEVRCTGLAGGSKVSGSTTTATGTGVGGGAGASKTGAPYSLDSSQRISYRPMARHPVLAVPHTRFGSNVPSKSEITQRVPLYYSNSYFPYCAPVTVLVLSRTTIVLYIVQYKYILKKLHVMYSYSYTCTNYFNY